MPMLMNWESMKMMGKGMAWMAKMPLTLSRTAKSITVIDHCNWEGEKLDILERTNWLCHEIIGTSEALIKKMPAVLGEEYSGQWAIYCCSMLAHALANIAVIYPETAQLCPTRIAQLIDMVNTPAMRRYDNVEFHEDAMETLNGNKSHMTYLSILAWMITNYKMAGGDNRYDTLLDVLCETLDRRMWKSPYELNLLSFPGKPIFLPDMLVAIVALKNYARLHGGKYQSTVDAWLHNAKTKWTDRRTGLLQSFLPGASRYQRNRALRGSYAALNCSYLSLIDENYARDQYEKLKAVFTIDATLFGTTVTGIREYLFKAPEFAFAAGDAGLVIKGLSAGGTAFGLGAPTFFEDWKLRSEFLRTAEVGGQTQQQQDMRHYKLGEMFMVGEATTLAMRTQINRY